MDQRVRHRNDDDPPSPGEVPGTEDLGARRDEATRLLAAADAAIERALSGNSAEFLAANRQRGGE